MDSPLLQTKLYIPPTRPEYVSRPRLIERLNTGLHQNQGFGRKLTLISAPAGFGKTTLLSEWVQAMGRVTPPIAVAWLSLDESDNDPVRFLAYFITALQTTETLQEPAAQQGPVAQQKPVGLIGKAASSALQSPQPPPTEAILTSLLNEIAALPDRLVLVLDDYHLIEAQPIHDALTFLLEHLPPQMHLVIATREDPHLSLARLRARGQLTELRGADLRFTSAEAAEFLNRVMGLDLSAEDIAALETRTEGWIAGLQLAAISMQGRKDASGFIQSFTGSHHFVLDYLVEEVLEQQTESVQTFLLQTAILDRLTGSLCDALTGQDNGQATLEMLDRANLFIISLDEERRWYRYHHLFADLLRQRLRQTQSEQVPTLHNKASEWYEQKGFVDEAIDHTLRGECFERAVHLIEAHADTIWQRGEHAKLRRWLDRLPAEVSSSKPQLCVFRAYYLLASGQHESGEILLKDIEKMLESISEHSSENLPEEKDRITESERIRLQGRVAAVRAFIHADQGNVSEIFRHASKALEYLPEQDLIWRNLTADNLADAHSYRGDLGAAYKARLEALEMSKAAGNIHYIILSNLRLALTLRHQGRLHRTLEVCRQQWQLADQFGLTSTIIVGCILAIWGEILAEMNDLDGAIQQAKKGVELTEHGWNLAIVGYSSLCLLRVFYSRGDLNSAEKIIQKMENTALEFDVPPWTLNQMAGWQARIWLDQGKLEAALQWMEERKLDTSEELIREREFNYYSLNDYITIARILIADNRLDKATTLLQHLIGPVEARGQTTRLIEILLLHALAFQSKSETPQALSILEHAIRLAEPEGFFRIFVDEGPPMAGLLYEAVTRGIAPDYARRLLATFPVAEPEQPAPSKTSPQKSELVEPLSERELEVLQLIAEGLTNPEIAARLYLTLNTVKVHTRNIYGKLDAHNRTQAVARARALGILPPI